MGKPEKSDNDELTPPASAPKSQAFRDLHYTSRTLILPRSGRSLAVAKGRVEVQPADTEALAFLKGNDEFALLTE